MTTRKTSPCDDCGHRHTPEQGCADHWWAEELCTAEGQCRPAADILDELIEPPTD